LFHFGQRGTALGAVFRRRLDRLSGFFFAFFGSVGFKLCFRGSFETGLFQCFGLFFFRLLVRCLGLLCSHRKGRRFFLGRRVGLEVDGELVGHFRLRLRLGLHERLRRRRFRHRDGCCFRLQGRRGFGLWRSGGRAVAVLGQRLAGKNDGLVVARLFLAATRLTASTKAAGRLVAAFPGAWPASFVGRAAVHHRTDGSGTAALRPASAATAAASTAMAASPAAPAGTVRAGFGQLQRRLVVDVGRLAVFFRFGLRLRLRLGVVRDGRGFRLVGLGQSGFDGRSDDFGEVDPLGVGELFELFEVVGDVEEGVALEPDVYERRLHAGQHAGNATLVDAAGQSDFLLAFNVELNKLSVLQQSHLGFVRGAGDDDFFGHRDTSAGRRNQGAAPGPARCAVRVVSLSRFGGGVSGPRPQV
jgi:hypothetical protein